MTRPRQLNPQSKVRRRNSQHEHITRSEIRLSEEVYAARAFSGHLKAYANEEWPARGCTKDELVDIGARCMREVDPVHIKRDKRCTFSFRRNEWGIATLFEILGVWEVVEPKCRMSFLPSAFDVRGRPYVDTRRRVQRAWQFSKQRAERKAAHRSLEVQRPRTREGTWGYNGPSSSVTPAPPPPRHIKRRASMSADSSTSFVSESPVRSIRSSASYRPSRSRSPLASSRSRASFATRTRSPPRVTVSSAPSPPNSPVFHEYDDPCRMMDERYESCCDKIGPEDIARINECTPGPSFIRSIEPDFYHDDESNAESTLPEGPSEGSSPTAGRFMGHGRGPIPDSWLITPDPEDVESNHEHASSRTGRAESTATETTFEGFSPARDEVDSTVDPEQVWPSSSQSDYVPELESSPAAMAEAGSSAQTSLEPEQAKATTSRSNMKQQEAVDGMTNVTNMLPESRQMTSLEFAHEYLKSVLGE